MKQFIYIFFLLIAVTTNAQEFINGGPLDFKISALETPIISFGVATPQNKFFISEVDLIDPVKPKEVNMLAVMTKSANVKKREVDIKSFGSFGSQKRKSSVISVEARANELRPNSYNFGNTGVRNISYKDSRLPSYYGYYRTPYIGY